MQSPKYGCFSDVYMRFLKKYNVCSNDGYNWFIYHSNDICDMENLSFLQSFADELACNEYESMMPLLEKYIDKLSNWNDISVNSNAMSILKKHPDKIVWKCLQRNTHPEAIRMIRENIDKIGEWKLIFANPELIDIIKENLDKADDTNKLFCLSNNPNAIEILKENPDKIEWIGLSRNPNAIEILRENKDKLDFDTLCTNPNPKAMQLIKEIMIKNGDTEFDDFSYIAENPNAISIIEQNINKFDTDDWKYLSWNENAGHLFFNLDYKRMRTIFQPIAKEMAEYVFHPVRMARFADKYGIDMADYMDYY